MEKVPYGAQDKPGQHPYLIGNFAPIQSELPLTPCLYTGTIPSCLAGGEYVRNGGNPLKNDELGRDAHWFDGDGMLSGVLFRRTGSSIQPEFVNAYVLTDIFLASAYSNHTTKPILPSIASLLNPISTFIAVTLRIMRTLLLVFLSHLPGTKQKITRISVANTGIFWHDGRALATCESGPPMRVTLPSLQSIGWYNGNRAEGEPLTAEVDVNTKNIYGDHSPIGWMKEWTTAHPRIDPNTKELISFHSCFLPPYVRYSIVPSEDEHQDTALDNSTDVSSCVQKSLYNVTVPGVSSAKMMHDFGVSREHTVILDLPLSLDPMNQMKNKPVVAFDAHASSRFGVFPRYHPERIQWFEEPEACCIFHTANTYDEADPLCTVSDCTKMLSCRLNSARLVFSLGNLPAPQTALAKNGKADVCQLYYHAFQRANETRNSKILHSFPLSAIPFEFPAIRPSASMGFVRYLYGCSLLVGNFSSALGRTAKIDCLVKVDVLRLLQKARGRTSLNHETPVDDRTIAEIIADNIEDDCIKVFKLPDGYYAQEMAFVPASSNATISMDTNMLDEDEGYLLTYVFNELEGIDETTGMPHEDAKSELWVINAKNMSEVVCKVTLPQRVPYGLHGTFFTEAQIASQRPIESLRQFTPLKSSSSLIKSATPNGLKDFLNRAVSALQRRLLSLLA